MTNHRILIALLGLLALTTFSRGIVAQDSKPEPCPELTLVAPPTPLKEKEIGDYSVIVDLKRVQQEISLQWSVIGGEILEGGGTQHVKIRRAAKDFFVSVRLRGARLRCEQLYRFPDIRSDGGPPEAILLDEITGSISDHDNEKIKRFLRAANAERDHVYWLVLGSTKDSKEADVSGRRETLLELFKSNGGLGEDVRLVFVDVQANENFIQFWKTTPNAKPPAVDR
jgi:hypothetical protein